MSLPFVPPVPGGAMAVEHYRRASAHHLNVSEVFGPTIQGEGPNAGRLSSFLRLAGCNLTCSWCDSAYTWDWDRFPHREEVHPTPVHEVAEQVSAMAGRIIVTGGEPLLQATALATLLAECEVQDFDVETNGTRPLGPTAAFWDTIICSPKVIPSADQGPAAHRLDPGILSDWRTHFKFVIRDQADLDAVDDLQCQPAFADARVEGRMWLMPEGITPDALTARTPMVIEAAVERGMNFTSRLHVYGWHDVRGH